MEEAIRTRDLVKRFAKTAAVDRLSLTVPRRAVYGFLGRNGAGKTTTVRLLLGLLRPDAGEITLFGHPLAAARRAGEHVGALVEAPSLYDHLTGRENLDLSRRLLGLPASEIDRVLAVVELTSAARRRVGGYSLGMRQRLAIARALLGSPRLLILDEPTNGLDPEGIADMRRLLTALPANGDATVIVSSHLLDEVERIATHVGLIDRGRLIAEGALANLQAAATAMIEVDSDAGAAATLQAHGMEASGKAGQLLVRSDRPDQVAALLVRGGHPIHRLVRRGRRLEQLFADATMREAA